MDAVAATCNMRVYPVLYKVNSYANGGFFKPHKDTPKSKRHIGTLVVCLPLPFEGGDLVLRHGGKTVTFDWAAAIRESRASLHWAFFFADVKHEILPITAGYRITLTYDILKKKRLKEDEIILDVLDGRETPLYSEIQKLWNDSDFLNAGGILAFGLQYAYPVKDKDWPQDFAGFLKGADRILYSTLLESTSDIRIQAVYCIEADPYEAEKYHLPECPMVDGFSSWFKTPSGSTYHPFNEKLLLTTDNFSGVRQGVYLGDNGDSDFRDKEECDELIEETGGRALPGIIWCRRSGPPISDARKIRDAQMENEAYAEASTYMHYGNEGYDGILLCSCSADYALPKGKRT